MVSKFYHILNANIKNISRFLFLKMIVENSISFRVIIQAFHFQLYMIDNIAKSATDQYLLIAAEHTQFIYITIPRDREIQPTL